MTTTSELRSKIDRKNEEISDVAHKIEDRIDQLKDWKRYVTDYPLQSVGVALGVGLILSGASGAIMRTVTHEAGTLAKGALKAGLMAAIFGGVSKQANEAT